MEVQCESGNSREVATIFGPVNLNVTKQCNDAALIFKEPCGHVMRPKAHFTSKAKHRRTSETITNVIVCFFAAGLCLFVVLLCLFVAISCLFCSLYICVLL